MPSPQVLPQVLVVGAGPTGLMLALQLARRGIAIRIIDKNSGPGLASRAMAMHARSLEFYAQLGLADAVIAGGFKMETLHLREGGEDIATVRFGDIGQGLSPFPFVLSYPQDDQERFLVAALETAGVTVEWNTELADFTQDSDGVTATLTKAGQSETATTLYICGCDGARSRVRHVLGLEFAGGEYEQLFYVADARVSGPATHDIFANLGADTLALMLPVRSSGMQRLIGTVPAAKSDRTDLTFEDVRAEAEGLIGVHVTEVNWFSTYRVHHRVAAHFRDGRAFLCGDAGHIHSPAGGQGMNTGLGDAVNLAWKLAEVLKHRAGETVLETYETERIAFARQLVATTDRAFRAGVDPSLVGRFMRTWLLPAIAPLASSVKAVREAMFRTVSQIMIRYPGSDLSDGAAGKIKGGDRLPFVAGEDGGNFAPQRGLEWRLQIHGDADPRFAREAAALAIPLDVFSWTEAADHAGFAKSAAYLVRPDGYVGWASKTQDAEALAAYLTARGIMTF
ncbi:FAD-dependent monooxygenase [soil metagenome]